MKKLLTLLICCAVFAAPVSAGDYFFYKDVNAEDFTNALVDYCNGNTVHNMSEHINLCNHKVKIFDVIRTGDSLNFRFNAYDYFILFTPIPMSHKYEFSGVMHINIGLQKPHTLSITDEDEKFTALGLNWWLEVKNDVLTRFKI